MKILTFTSLFPNSLQPNNAIFIKNRIYHVQKHFPVELKVVAPVPYFPKIKVANKKWSIFAHIPKEEYIDGIKVYHPRYIVTPKVGMSLYGVSMFLGTLPTIKRIYKNFPFDIIDSHFIYPDGFAAILLAKYFKKPVILSARGTDINLYPKFPLIKKLIQYTLNECSLIISVCSFLKEIMIKLGIPAKKIYVIPNGIDPKNFFFIEKSKAREKLKIDKNDKILLSVGALIECKGYHILLDALNILQLKNKLNFKTCIIGEGEWREKLEKKIKKYNLNNKVFLIGLVPNKELVWWYNAADIFFLGSSREGWPNVINEALACGLPVIATKVNGIPEIITSEEYGIIVNRTPTDFVYAIQQAFNKKWNYEKIYKYGQSRTWKTVAKEVYHVFEEALTNK